VLYEKQNATIMIVAASPTSSNSKKKQLPASGRPEVSL
jgi:hypothetical protein